MPAAAIHGVHDVDDKTMAGCNRWDGRAARGPALGWVRGRSGQRLREERGSSGEPCGCGALHVHLPAGSGPFEHHVGGVPDREVWAVRLRGADDAQAEVRLTGRAGQRPTRAATNAPIRSRA
jgi:hypothetical protein